MLKESGYGESFSIYGIDKYKNKSTKDFKKLIDEYKIDGVIDVALQSCHPFNVESHKIKEFVVNKKHIDYMTIETDYSETDTEQLRTRFEAFIEMIEDKK